MKRIIRILQGPGNCFQALDCLCENEMEGAMSRKKSLKNKYELSDGFSLVELIIVIAIMVILVGVIALAVIPNIQRSKESKDISALDNIASAANSAIATTQAKGAGVIVLGTTSSGIQDVSGYNPTSASEAETLQHTIYQTLPEGAGKTESNAIGNSAKIAFAYDVSDLKIQVAYVDTVTPSNTNYSELHGIACEYINQDFFVSNGS